MKGLRRGMVLLALGAMLVLTGCAESGGEPAGPEAVVHTVLAACQEADYGRAAKYFEGGARLWETQPQYVREYLDELCSQGKAVAFKVEDQRDRGDIRLIHLTTYSDQELKTGLKTKTWHFQQQKASWMIIKVE